MTHTASAARRGLWHGVAAYGLWGVVPAFWKLLAGVPAVEVLAHRVVWGLGAFAILVGATGAAPAVRAAIADRATLARMALSGALLSINWGVFVAAIATGHLRDASLGYFINPLMSVALGTVVLGERLRRLQWLAIGAAATGVAIGAWRAGRLPWISLVLATSFAIYGLIRKRARVDTLAGSTLETLVIAPVAVAYLIALAARGDGQLGHATLGTHALLVATGAVTVIPLLLFTSAARRLPLSTVGFLQYLAPTGQLALAIAYGEPFALDQLAMFGPIWLGLVLFTVDLARAAAISRTAR